MASSSNISTASHLPSVLKGLVLPVLVAAVSLSVAFVGALIIGKDSGIDGVNGFVESLSGGSSSFLGDFGLIFGFAFGAGMVSAVNPCGFAMLPAYLGLYLGTNERGSQQTNPIHNLGRAVLVGGSVTAGFVILFGVTGTVIKLGAQSLFADVVPWLGLIIGIVLAMVGAWLVGGGKLYSGLAARAASHMGDPGTVSPKGYFMFGLSYGTASLSCTLPIFVTVVGTSLTLSNLLPSIAQFVLYAMGMGLVIMVLTLGMAFFKVAMVKGVRKTLPYVQPIGSWLMVIAGAYIVFYWLTIGGLL